MEVKEGKGVKKRKNQRKNGTTAFSNGKGIKNCRRDGWEEKGTKLRCGMYMSKFPMMNGE